MYLLRVIRGVERDFLLVCLLVFVWADLCELGTLMLVSECRLEQRVRCFGGLRRFQVFLQLLEADRLPALHIKANAVDPSPVDTKGSAVLDDLSSDFPRAVQKGDPVSDAKAGRWLCTGTDSK